MEITFIKITNYRNLNGLEVAINKDINFIVGENNIGKSNFQNCLTKILSCKSFQKEDFTDDKESLSVDMTFHLNDEEIGIFDDLVDPTNREMINIVAIQENPDEYIRYYHKETGETIPNSLIKKVNVISYDSLRNPKNEIDFSKTKGAGAFLNFIVKRYIEDYAGTGILKKSEVRKVEKYISKSLGNLNAFSRFGIKPKVDVDDADILSRVLLLKDENDISIPENGYGVQYNLLIMLSLLEKIIDFRKRAKDTDTEFSALLIFDEPEIHLHPYLQRTLIRDIYRLALGQDAQFNDLLNEYFGITQIHAQIIITTHSPNILGDDYTKIIRMFNRGDFTAAVSCSNLIFDYKEQKQLLMQFEYIKEAVFARAAIIVEGESEYGSFKMFADTLGVDFDQEGIALIKAGGAESILPIIKLFNKLEIKAVGVIDNDKKIEKNLPDKEYLFYTKSKCFDSEIVKRVIYNKRYDILEAILTEYDSQGDNRCMQQKKINEVIKTFNYKRINANKNYRFKDVDTTNPLYEVMYVSWFSINKGILLGKTIGRHLDKKNIPVCYVKAIKKVKEYADESRK
ncbi:MAG: AAA family ATPase [Lachnospiraceae bacterium]|nr:AAA family ATPase [Lachnospiraceae bacterium]